MDGAVPVNQERMDDFLAKFVVDYGAALHGATVVLGEKLGLYKALAKGGPMTPKDLAAKTETTERYVREWLAAQAASGYVCLDAKTGRYWMSPEQAAALADETNPAYLPGAFQIAASVFRDGDKIGEAFRTGQGFGWHEHERDLFEGTAKFFSPGNAGNLGSWLTTLEGVVGKLEAGARVADVGCGYGASTLLMAKAYPKSTFFGYDYHKQSIVQAREKALRAGLDNRVKFEVSFAKEYPGRDYDFVTVFDCLHDLGDPLGASKHILRSLKSDGTWMIVEPFANEQPEDNLNPVGRIFYSASAMICTPASLSQEVGLALGNQVSDSRLREIVLDAGFGSFRRAAETRFNRVFEARP